jgi:hypothetical protein
MAHTSKSMPQTGHSAMYPATILGSIRGALTAGG